MGFLDSLAEAAGLDDIADSLKEKANSLNKGKSKEEGSSDNKRGEEKEGTADGSEIRAKLKAVVLSDDWDSTDETDSKTDLIKDLLNSVGAGLDNFKTKYEVNDDDCIEIRGSLNDFPVKVSVNVRDFKTETFVKVNYADSSPRPMINYDLTKVPKERASTEEDPWADDDEIRVFVGEGVFFESSDEDDIEENLSYWEQIDESTRKALIEGLTEHKIEMISATYDEIETSYWNAEDLLQPSDTSKAIVACLSLSILIAKSLEGVIVKESSGDTRVNKLVTCKYCSTKYPLGTDANCVNCHAPHT